MKGTKKQKNQTNEPIKDPAKIATLFSALVQDSKVSEVEGS